MTDQYEKRRQQKRKWQRSANALRRLQKTLIEKQYDYAMAEWSDDFLKERVDKHFTSMAVQCANLAQDFEWLLKTLSGE